MFLYLAVTDEPEGTATMLLAAALAAAAAGLLIGLNGPEPRRAEVRVEARKR
jgi:hypothetical protein